MKAYTIFDDFPQSSLDILRKAGINVDVQPKGMERPQDNGLKRLLDDYDIIFISTAQKMPEKMFANVTTPKIIGTASSGIDHIHIPKDKQHLVKVVNATHANRTTVAEHTFALLLALRKQLLEGRKVASEGKSKKEMEGKPVDLLGSTIGVVGAGGIASTILRVAGCFGMKRLCWTLHPAQHMDLKEEGVEFVSLETLFSQSDNISINIPLSDMTRGVVTRELISLMKENAVVTVTSRLEVVDADALFEKSKTCASFSLGIDADAAGIKDLWDNGQNNVIVTPHIAGGTIASRIRLFDECSENVVKCMK